MDEFWSFDPSSFATLFTIFSSLSMNEVSSAFVAQVKLNTFLAFVRRAMKLVLEVSHLRSYSLRLSCLQR